MDGAPFDEECPPEDFYWAFRRVLVDELARPTYMLSMPLVTSVPSHVRESWGMNRRTDNPRLTMLKCPFNQNLAQNKYCTRREDLTAGLA